MTRLLVLRRPSAMSIGIGRFHQSLDERDLATLKLSRNIFHGSTIIPFLLYHLRLSDAKPLFPATISHTIRKGPPRYLGKNTPSTHPEYITSHS